MKNMTSQQIHARLAELAREQTAHDARDLDAELRDCLLAGGNADALEERQLQAEREARRLRVERQALEVALPDAEKAEALAEIEKLAEGMKGHIKKFRENALAIASLLEQADKLDKEINQINSVRCAGHVAANRLAKKHSLPNSVLEPFRRLETRVYPFKDDHGFAEGVDIWEYRANAIKID